MRDCVTGAARFPLRLALKSPSSTDISEKFSEFRSWLSALSSESNVRVEWQEVRHRVQGTQRIPSSVWVDSLDVLLRWIRKKDEWLAFSEVVAMTASRQPALLSWLERHPMQGLKFSQSWRELLDVISWLQENPRPGIYLRQVDLPGINSKFIERHRKILSDLFDLALTSDVIDNNHSGVDGFCARYGFLDKPNRIRFRILDSAICPLPGMEFPDLTLDSSSFSKLALNLDRVFITENEVNFLAFPSAPKSIVIFGSGYGWEALSKSEWLSTVPIHYWGDLDTHGFAILSSLRTHFNHVQSFLMDLETLEQHRAFWGTEESPSALNLPHLNHDEQRALEFLRNNTIQSNLRLEQEYVGYQWMLDRIQTICSAG